MFWKETAGEVPVHAAVTVSKKNFKSAVQRNLLKRRMREAYRKNKQPLINVLHEKNKKVDLMFLHVSKELSDYKKIENGMISVMEKLQAQL
jgi:ribonuclease P protein component